MISKSFKKQLISEFYKQQFIHTEDDFKWNIRSFFGEKTQLLFRVRVFLYNVSDIKFHDTFFNKSFYSQLFYFYREIVIHDVVIKGFVRGYLDELENNYDKQISFSIELKNDEYKTYSKYLENIHD